MEPIRSLGLIGLFGSLNKLLDPSSTLEKIILEILELQEYTTSICKNCIEYCIIYFGSRTLSQVE